MRRLKKILISFQIAFRATLILGALIATFGEAVVIAAVPVSANDKKPLRVLVNGNGLPVFSDDGGVQGLETVLAAVLGQLVYSSGSFDLKPGLLSSYRWDYEKKRYVLQLREGVRFQNGRRATAEDLEFSLLRGLLSAKDSWFKSFFANVEGISELTGEHEFKSGMVSGIRVLDSRRLAIKLSAPNPSFLHSLSRSYFSLVPREELKSDYLTWKRYPVGAGSYKVVKASPDLTSLDLENVDDSSPGIKHITITSRGNPQDYDLVIGVPLDRTSLSVASTDSATSVTGLYFNFENELGKQLAFRKALSLAVKRAALIQGEPAYRANNELLASQFWGRRNLGEEQDLKKARSEVAQVRPLLPKEPIRVPVFNSEFGNGAFGAYLGVLKSQLTEIGLDVEFYKSEKKFFDESDHSLPFRIISLGSDVVDPLVLFGLFRKGSPMKPHFPANDEAYEILYEKAAKAAALDVKVQAVRALSNYFAENVYAVPIFERRGIVGFKEDSIRALNLSSNSLAVYLDQVVKR